MPPGSAEAIVVADVPRELTRAVAQIHSSATLWYRLSDAAVAYARSNFAIETITAKIRTPLVSLGLPNDGGRTP